MSRACFALAIAGVLGLFCAGVGLPGSSPDSLVLGQEAKQAKEPPVAAVPGSDEDELRRLLEIRFNAASAVFARALELYERGSANSSIENVCGSFERFVTASAELAKSPAERVKVLENALLTAKQIDDKTRALIDRQKVEESSRGRVPSVAREQTKYTVAQIEIDLIHARRAAAGR